MKASICKIGFCITLISFHPFQRWKSNTVFLLPFEETLRQRPKTRRNIEYYFIFSRKQIVKQSGASFFFFFSPFSRCFWGRRGAGPPGEAGLQHKAMLGPLAGLRGCSDGHCHIYVTSP